MSFNSDFYSASDIPTPLPRIRRSKRRQASSAARDDGSTSPYVPEEPSPATVAAASDRPPPRYVTTISDSQPEAERQEPPCYSRLSPTRQAGRVSLVNRWLSPHVGQSKACCYSNCVT